MYDVKFYLIGPLWAVHELAFFICIFIWYRILLLIMHIDYYQHISVFGSYFVGIYITYSDELVQEIDPIIKQQWHRGKQLVHMWCLWCVVSLHLLGNDPWCPNIMRSYFCLNPIMIYICSNIHFQSGACIHHHIYSYISVTFAIWRHKRVRLMLLYSKIPAQTIYLTQYRFSHRWLMENWPFIEMRMRKLCCLDIGKNLKTRDLHVNTANAMQCIFPSDWSNEQEIIIEIRFNNKIPIKNGISIRYTRPISLIRNDSMFVFDCIYVFAQEKHRCHVSQKSYCLVIAVIAGVPFTNMV